MKDAYILANAPTVAEIALYNAFHGIKTIERSVESSVEHSAKYTSGDMFYKAVMEHLTPALESVEGFKKLLKANMWRCTCKQSVKAYLLYRFQTDEPVEKVWKKIAGK